MSRTRIPADHLREVPGILRRQWKQHVASQATVLRWLVAADEWEWVEEFLEGRLDGRSRVFVVEAPADTMQGYGFAAASALLPALVKTKLGRRPAFVVPALARGQRDDEALARILGAFSAHVRGPRAANSHSFSVGSRAPRA